MENVLISEQQPALIASDQGQFLTFRLDTEEYGIEILKVQEIKGWDKVTSIPNSPPYIKGVLNLRGTIVPIIDLRLRFNLKQVEYDLFTVIVVVNVGRRIAGFVVDAVNDVLNINANQHCPAPQFEGQQLRDFIKGLAQVDDRLVILLDIDKLVSAEALRVGEGVKIN